MSRFKINIHQLQEENSILKDKYHQYKMDQDSLYAVALTADGSWNDNNTSVFINCVESDKKTVVKFHDTFYQYLNSIDNFTSKLDTILSTNGVADKKKELFYDEDYCKNSISLLQSCQEELRTAKSKIAENSVGCNASSSIQMVSSAITECIQSLGKIENGMANIQKGIETLIETTSSFMKSHDAVLIMDNELKYNWETETSVTSNSNLFKTKLQDRNNSSGQELEKKEVLIESVPSSSAFITSTNQLKTTSSDVSVNSVNDHNVQPTTLKNQDFVVPTYEQNNEYQGMQYKMNALNQDLTITKREDFGVEEVKFMSDNPTSIDVTKQEDYSTDRTSLNVSPNISVGGSGVEKFETSSNNLKPVESGTIQIEKTEYTDSEVSFNRDISMDVSLERDHSFEE